MPFDSAQEQIDIGPNGLVMAAVHRHAKDLMQEAMVDDHPDEGAGGNERIHLMKRSFEDSGLNVCGQVIVQDSMMFSEKHLGSFMAFERAEQEQSKKG